MFDLHRKWPTTNHRIIVCHVHLARRLNTVFDSRFWAPRPARSGLLGVNTTFYSVVCGRADVADMRELFDREGHRVWQRKRIAMVSVNWLVVVETWKRDEEVECPLIARFVMAPVVSEFWFDNAIVMAGYQAAIHLTQKALAGGRSHVVVGGTCARTHALVCVSWILTHGLLNRSPDVVFSGRPERCFVFINNSQSIARLVGSLVRLLWVRLIRYLTVAKIVGFGRL